LIGKQKALTKISLDSAMFLESAPHLVKKKIDSLLIDFFFVFFLFNPQRYKKRKIIRHRFKQQQVEIKDQWVNNPTFVRSDFTFLAQLRLPPPRHSSQKIVPTPSIC